MELKKFKDCLDEFISNKEEALILSFHEIIKENRRCLCIDIFDEKGFKRSLNYIYKMENVEKSINEFIHFLLVDCHSELPQKDKSNKEKLIAMYNFLNTPSIYFTDMESLDKYFSNSKEFDTLSKFKEFIKNYIIDKTQQYFTDDYIKLKRFLYYNVSDNYLKSRKINIGEEIGEFKGEFLNENVRNNLQK